MWLKEEYADMNKRLVSLVLLLVVTLSSVMGCGKNVSTDNISTEETKVEEVTEIETETETVSRFTATYTYDLDKSRYPISDETETMLIEKLTNLTLKKDEEFDMNSLSFKEDEKKAYSKLKDVLADVLYAKKSEDSILKSDIDYVKLESIEDLDTGLVFKFKQGNRYNTLNDGNMRSKELKLMYSYYPISKATQALVVSKLDGLTFERGQEFDKNSFLYTISDETVASVINKYNQAGNGDVSLTDEEARYVFRNALIAGLTHATTLRYKSGSSTDNMLIQRGFEFRIDVENTDECLIISLKYFF